MNDLNRSRFRDAFFPKFKAKRPRMGKVNFTEDFKRNAALQITEDGCLVAKAATGSGFSKYSLYEWRKRCGKPVVTTRYDEHAADAVG